jgi:hypothetical protein
MSNAAVTDSRSLSNAALGSRLPDENLVALDVRGSEGTDLLEGVAAHLVCLLLARSHRVLGLPHRVGHEVAGAPIAIATAPLKPGIVRASGRTSSLNTFVAVSTLSEEVLNAVFRAYIAPSPLASALA